MGVKFSHCRNMDERKALSLDIASVVKNGFRKLLSGIIGEYESYSAFLDMDKLKNSGRKILPIRPIIIGGDDVTFICPGRLGLEYARRFIEYVNEYELLNDDFHKHIIASLEQRNSNGSEVKISNKFSCCGGIAIVPAKYPFFRTYELAEQLCSAAKQKSRIDDGCYIDFILLHGEMSGDLEQLREQQYTGVCGNLHFGPYNVLDKRAECYIGKLLKLVKAFNGKDMPNNKVKELRSVLHEDLHSIKIFLENCKQIRDVVRAERKKETIVPEDLWEKADGQQATRYIDAIEMMDYVIPEN